MDKLIAGVDRFRSDAFPQRSESFRILASEGQSPKTLMISCADSRVVPELITQSEPGDLFVTRNAGNIVPPWSPADCAVTSAIEFAVSALGVTDIVVCGHSDCGAMKGCMNPHALDALPAVSRWLVHSQAAHAVVTSRDADLNPDEQLNSLIEQNVVQQLLHLRSHPSVAAKLQQGELRLHGWVFDIESGSIRALDGATGVFTELAGVEAPVAEYGRNPSRERKAA